MPPTFSIGEVAERFGLSPSALRFYESIGLLPEPERTSGRRRYTQETIDQLAIVAAAQRAGFTLREATTLLTGLQADAAPTDEWRELAQDKLAELEALAGRIEEMRAILHRGLACDCLALEDVEGFRAQCVAWADADVSAPR